MSFRGLLKIGKYTNLNCETEVRCDESVEIGKFCMISYNVRIWDTNTHQQIPIEDRRNRTMKFFPSFGVETDRPSTRRVVIGDDCWLGESASILKGSQLGQHVTIGYNTLIIGTHIPDNVSVVGENNIKIFGANA